jgi:N-formylglutamate deformylase
LARLVAAKRVLYSADPDARDVMARKAVAMSDDTVTSRQRAKIADDKLWRVEKGVGPFLGLAVHAGHQMRPALKNVLAIDRETRLREEDPFTDRIAALCGSHVVTFRSRFEVDLNRPPSEAICVQPEDCWNLRVWNEDDGLTQTMYRRSLAEHEAFYDMLGQLLSQMASREGRFVVLDCHSYNHRRAGPGAPPADPALNPEINIGTGTMDRTYWAPVVDHFISALGEQDYLERSLDVRENVKFRGRYVAQFIHDRFPRTGCCLAVEVKKFFMDEWTGELDETAFEALLSVFRNALTSLDDVLRTLKCHTDQPT